MNLISNLLTVCLTISILAPMQKAFGAGATHHTKEQKIQHLVCVKETPYSLQCEVENSQRPLESESRKSTLALRVANSSTNTSIAQRNQHQNTNIIEVLLLLVCVGSTSLGLFLYVKNRNNRAVVLEQNIEFLERMWKISNAKRE